MTHAPTGSVTVNIFEPSILSTLCCSPETSYAHVNIASEGKRVGTLFFHDGIAGVKRLRDELDKTITECESDE